MIGRKCGDPFAKLEDRIKKIPFGADRQRKDLQELHEQNRNPRLSTLTATDLARSETFIHPTYDPKTLSDALIKMKAEAFNQVTDLSLADCLNKFQGTEETHINDTCQTNISTVLSLPTEVYDNKSSSMMHPPSFGHRPGSGSRMFYLGNMVNENKLKTPPEKKERNGNDNEVKGRNFSTGKAGMSSSLLLHLLNPRISLSLPGNENEVATESSHRGRKSLKNKKISNSTKFVNCDITQSKITRSIKLGSIDDSLYEVWKDDNIFPWDKSYLAKTRSHNSMFSLSDPNQIQDKIINPDERGAEDKSTSEVFSEFSPPNWKIKVDQMFPQRRKGTVRKSSSSTRKQSSGIIGLQNERKKVLEKRVRMHEKLVEMERVGRIKDRLTMPTQWERIMQRGAFIQANI